MLISIHGVESGRNPGIGHVDSENGSAHAIGVADIKPILYIEEERSEMVEEVEAAQ